MRYAFFDVDGRVTLSANDDTVQALPEGAIELSEAQWDGRFALRLVSGELIADQQPADIAALKAAKNREINAARHAANLGDFEHDGHLFSADLLSRSDIDGCNGYVALNGALPPAFPGVWKTADQPVNQYYPIADVTAWKSFYASMVTAGALNFARSEALKAQLEAAATKEAIAAISW